MLRIVLALCLFMLGTAALTQDDSPPRRDDPDEIAAIIASRGVPPDAAPLDPFFFSHEVIPPTIKVGITGHLHCSEWLNDGQPVERIDEMPFDEYVKNVLPNEWVQSWDMEALRAGAMAVKMFAWWRINLGGVRPGGADVVDNTCDQVYIANSSRVSTDAAVDDTWNHMMRENGRVVEIHYLNTDTNCQRYFPGIRCMGQWGSQGMAEDGATWQDILHRYYDPVEITLGQSNLGVLPTEQDIMRNGDFSAAYDGWTLFGETDWALYDGALAIKRNSAGAGDSRGGGVLQVLPYLVDAGANFEITLQMGNTSTVTKRPRVILRGSSRAGDEVICQFEVPPGAPLRSYVMRAAAPAGWSAPRLEIHPDPADSQPDLLLDNIRAYQRPNLSAAGCHGPASRSDWSFGSGPGGWTINTGLGNPRLDALGTRYDMTGPGPSLLSPALLNTDADALSHVVIRMAATIDDCGAIYFEREGQSGFSTAQRVRFDLVPDGGLRTYYIRMADHDLWGGRITRLLLEPACEAGVSGYITLNYLALTNADTTPILLSPSGTVGDAYGNPLYTWSAVPGADAYQLWVGDAAARQIVNERVWAAEHCTSEECTFDPTTISDDHRLSNGDHMVFLLAYVGGQAGSWAGPFSFRLEASPPGLPTLRPVTATETTLPVFNWELSGGAANANRFWLYAAPVDDVTDARVNTWVTRAEACGSMNSTTCSLRADTDFANGRYSVYIYAEGPGGASGWAGPQGFQVRGNIPPAPANIIATSDQPRPTITWDHHPDAAWFRVYIGSTDGVVIHDEWHRKTARLCDAARCTLTPEINPVNGRYVVYIQAWGAGGVGAWGGPGNFALNLPTPDAPTLIPITDTDGAVLRFSWNPAQYATWYRLHITREAETVHEAWYPADCGATCALTPTLDLPNGVYSWRVSAWGPGGGGAPSSTQTFSIDALPPGIPVLVEANNTTFVWRSVTDATWYAIQIDDVDGAYFSRWYRVTDPALRCEGVLCTLSPDDLTLPNGAYTWRARAYTPYGVGAWSNPMAFTMG